MRVLVTGSRTWTSKFIIAQEMAKLGKGPGIILVYGKCPKGADAIAESVARELKWTLEPHPANWGKYGRGAGFSRNREMVNLGADICLAFIHNQSKGATHCKTLAERAGILTRVFTVTGPQNREEFIDQYKPRKGL